MSREFVFIWRIKNYSACYQTDGECIESASFAVESLSGLWHLQFFPKGNATTDHVSCYLVWEKSSEIVATPAVNFSIEIVVGKNVVLQCKKTKHEFSEEETDWGWHRFMDISHLNKEMDLWEDDALTLRCNIKCDQLKNPTIVRTKACTVIDVIRRCFEWDVTAPILMEHSESISISLSDAYSFEFTVTTLEGLKISIRLKEHKDIIALPIMFKMTLCDKKGNEIVSKHAKHAFEGTKEWELPDFISNAALEACSYNSNVYEFRLKCDVYISSKQILFSSITNEYFDSSNVRSAKSNAGPETAMQKDFRSLIVSKKYSDVTVRVDKEEFSVHKLVLRARSPVFEAMFDQNMLENETGIVVVTDVDGKTMRTFLEYLYTETVDTMDYESAKKLLLAADKYQVPSLVEVCVFFLRSVLCDENACEVLTFANSLHCERLKLYALDFITLNSSKILNTPNWRQWIMENIELATDILAKLSMEYMPKNK